MPCHPLAGDAVSDLKEDAAAGGGFMSARQHHARRVCFSPRRGDVEEADDRRHPTATYPSHRTHAHSTYPTHSTHPTYDLRPRIGPSVGAGGLGEGKGMGMGMGMGKGMGMGMGKGIGIGKGVVMGTTYKRYTNPNPSGSR
jgi:hypothetical protein